MADWVNAVLSQIGNRYLDLDPDSQQRLLALENKTLCIQFTDWELELYATGENGRLKIFFAQEQEFDARLSGTTKEILGLGMAAKKEDKFFKGEVAISGQISVGQQFQDLFQQLDIDWEEHLSTLVGDRLAHPLYSEFSRAAHWLRNTAENFRMNTSEYLREEALQLPYQDEIDDFRSQVTVLRDDVERLQQRIDRLFINKESD